MDHGISFIRENYLKNRTTVSKDIPGILQNIAEASGLPLVTHAYPTGAEHATWVVPPRWDVREAWLKDPQGRVVASYDQNPLFLAPYSHAVHQNISRDELLHHVRAHTSCRDAFFYEHRLAYDYQRRLREWIITLPQNVIDDLKDGIYEICIDVEVENGEMLIGEITLPGSGEGRIALLADYCHPAIVNDSFSGIAAFIEVLRRLKAQGELSHSVSLFIFPETIGSSIFLADREDIIDTLSLAIFSEFVGWGEEWQVKESRHDGSLANKLIDEMRLTHPDVRRVGPFDSYGNDELVFDYAGVPSISLQKYPCHEYHSSDDDLSRLEASTLSRAVDLIEHMIRTCDADRVLASPFPVPPYLSRFNLYADASHASVTYKERRDILHAFARPNSLLDVSLAVNQPMSQVDSFARSLMREDLLVEKPRSDYWHKTKGLIGFPETLKRLSRLDK